MADISRFPRLKVVPSSPDPTNPYDTLVQQDTQEQAHTNVVADPRDPAAARKANVVGGQLGIPGNTVEADLPGFSLDAHASQTRNLFSFSSSLPSWYAQPDNAARTKDDIGALGPLAGVFDNSARTYDPMAAQRAIRGTLGFNQPVNFSDRLTVATRAAATAPPAVSHTMTEAVGLSVAQGIDKTVAGAGQYLDEMGLISYHPGTDAFEQQKTTLGQFDERIAANMEGKSTFQQMAVDAVTSITNMGMMFATGKEAVLPLMAAEQGFGDYYDFRARGVNAPLAALAGATTGSIEAATEAIGLPFLTNRFGKKYAEHFVMGLLTREIPGELVATGTETAIDAALPGGEGEKKWWEALPHRLLMTAGSTALMVGGLGGLHKVMQRLAPEVRTVEQDAQAKTDAATLDQIMEHAAQSKTAKEDPSTFIKFGEHVSENSPIRNVYIPGEAIANYMQSDGYKPGPLERYSDQVAEAQATQGDVVIPVAEAAAYLAGTPAWEALKGDARLTADGATPNEAADPKRQADLAASLEAKGAAIADAGKSAAEAVDAAQPIYEDVKNRLLAGGLSSIEADRHAQAYAMHHVARADEWTKGGVAMTPAESYAQEKVVFPGEDASVAQGRTLSQEHAPLEGLPSKIMVDGKQETFGPHGPAREAAQRVADKLGIPYNPPRTYAKVDEARAKRIADAFEAMPHNPSDPTTKAAYRAMIDETLTQFHEIMKTGLKIEFIPPGAADPYGNPRNAILDVRNNNHLWVYPTDSGFGSSGADVSGNPLLEKTGITIGGHELLANDVFRVVHDYFGHIKEGVGFRHDGEENAWRAHAAMYSPLARRAMTTETRGQNSWVNFGPHGEKNRTASGADTVYADQKIGLLPEWVSEDGAGDRTLNQSALAGGYEGLAMHLSDEEKAGLRDKMKAKLMDLAAMLPDAKEMAAVATAGRAKKGWYENSANAILDVFGAHDAPRFAALLAALSPQTSVESNLYNALQTWANWNEAGRPTDRKAIVEVMGASVQGGKGVGSVLTAWINNSVNALSHPDPGKIKLSGPKVDSFMNNLVGVVDEVTNDTWMANYSGVDPTFVSGRTDKTGIKAKSPGYKAMNAVVRAAAKVASSITGEDWSPAEIQEAVWSFAKTLYEARDTAGETRTMRQLLEAGHVTHDDIANTPDFATLFADGVYKTILEKAGYSTEGLGSNRRAVGVDGQASVDVKPEGLDLADEDWHAFLGQAADRLERTRNTRRGLNGEPSQRELFQSDVLPSAGWAPERTSGLIDQFGNEDGSSRAIAVMMTPDEFLGALASEKGRELIDQRVSTLPEYGEGLDIEKLRASEPLSITVARHDTQWAMVQGHSGRHRATLLKQAGIQRIPVVVYLNGDSVSEPTKIDALGNRSRSDQTAIGDRRVQVEGVPISWKYKDQLDQLGGRTLFQQSDKPFYSALGRAIDESKTTKAPGDQWAATLRKIPGVKQEELEWSGLLDFLKDYEGPITKDKLVALMADGGIKVEEVILGGVPAEPVESDYLDEESFNSAYRVWAMAEDGARDPQFHHWSSDPGNPTYRELLITVPPRLGGNPSRAPSTHWDQEGVIAHARFMDKTDADGKRVLFIEEVQSDWHQKGRDEGYAQPATAEKIAAAQAAFEEANTAHRKAKDRLAAAINAISPEAEMDGSQSSRELGLEASRLILGVLADMPRTPEQHAELQEAEQTAPRFELRMAEARSALRDLATPQGIPNAPFRTSWPALVMKRMIRHAAENGYDRIAWTTGEEQASRYNLSTAVGTITYRMQEDGRVKVNTEGDRGYAALRQFGEMGPAGSTLFTEAQAKETFGQEIARKMWAGEGSEPDSTGHRKLEGSDLKIGGEGMKAFYDRNLVNITNDIVKKYGAKVGTVGIKSAKQERELGEAERTLRLTEVGIRDDEVLAKVDPVAERRLQSEFISDGGYRARDHLVAEIAALKQGSAHPGFEMTDQMRQAALGGLPLFQNDNGPRGSVTFQSDGTKIIQLFATANRSTLIHETGHIWTQQLFDDAARPDAPQSIKDRAKVMADWFAKLGHPVVDGVIPTEAHEYAARGFETHMMTGKAPTAALRPVFASFRAWLLRIYQVAKNLNSPITPEVREVFDRMLATQDAIDNEREIQHVAPLFGTAADAGMTTAEFADYQTRVADARDEAYDALLYKTMEAIRRREDGKLREQRANARADAAAAIAARPEFRALHLLRTGRTLGDPTREVQRVKLNAGWLIDNYGAEILDQLPKGLPIVAADGDHGDTVAEMVGMPSGDALVQALKGMRIATDQLRAEGDTKSLRDRLVEDQVNKVMAERHGDVMDDGSIEEEAIAALNTARQGEIIAQEAKQLAKRTSVVGVPTPYQFAREWAKRKVAAGKVRDVASRAAVQQYTRAAAKTARAAEKAILDGDIDEAFRQKQAQLLNHALLAESKAAADRIDTIVRRLRKLAGRAAMQSVDQDYMDKVHMLLENYDFRPRSQKSIDEQAGFEEWIQRQRDMGFEVHVPPRLENRGDPYSRVSVEELESLGDLVDSLIALGRTKQRLVTAGKERDFAEWRDEVAARIRALPDRKLPETPINEKKRLLAGVASDFLKIEALVEDLDGGPTGPLNDAIIVGAANAENVRHDLRTRILQPIAQTYKSLGKKQWARLQERITIPELMWNTLNEGDPRTGQPVTLTRSELLAVLLNMGNVSNLEKLSKGERWPVATLRAVMDREMTKEDFDLAQTLWHQVGVLWPEIVKNEREMSGVVPEKVDDMPFETKFGTYQGGYWPVVYDASRWQKAEDMEAQAADDMFGVRSGLNTQKGHTITRTAAFGPINLSVENVLFAHVEQVVTRIAFGPFARDVLRIVNDRTIRGLLDTKLGPEYRAQIKPWLARQIHNGAVFTKAARWWEKILKQARINMTIAGMGFRISTGVAQTVGLTASAQRIGAKYVGMGLKRLATHPVEMAKFVYDRSPEMVHRTEEVNREVAELSEQLRNKHGGVLSLAQHYAFAHIGMCDRYLVAVPTWLGAHQKGLDEGMTDEEASAYADKSVRMSQGTGRIKDLAAVQSTNNEAMRFLTMFYSPFNVMFNAQWQGVRGLKEGKIGPAVGVAFWWMTASMLGDALVSGDWPDWEDPEAILGWFARNVFFGMFAGIPVLRDMMSAAEQKVAGNYSSYGSTPLDRVYKTIEQVAQEAKRYGETGEGPKAPIKEGGSLAAQAFGIPTGQIGATAQFLWDYSEGNADPQTVSDWYFGLTKGKVPPKTGDPSQ